MKDSRILKVLCYISIPILIGLIIISIFYEVMKDEYNEETYYESDDFVLSYMDKLSSIVNELIYQNEYYKKSINDGDIEIFYVTNDIGYNINVKEFKYLVIYKNKAFTNIELTTDTKTLESIKSCINEKENIKTVEMKNGEIKSNSEVIQRKGIKYLDFFIDRYYESKTDLETNTIYREYTTTNAKDFEIYSSYIEEFNENLEKTFALQTMERMKIIINNTYIIIPACSIILILMIIYLIISIGYKKGKEGIDLNDFDKIPFEIISFIFLMIGTLAIVPAYEIDNLNVKLKIALIVTSYFVIYSLSAIAVNTLIKRIKSKTFIKTTITGKVLIFIKKQFEKIIKKLKEIKETLYYSKNITSKTLLKIAKIGIIEIIILIIFNESGFMLFLSEVILIIWVCYKIIKEIKYLEKIENKLKEMYEGNNQNNLEIADFPVEFQNSVKYINDISNGFENASKEMMKSERLKIELITNVSHDIKTPLTSIINYVDLLKQEKIENHKAKEYIEILDNKSQRLKKLTEDLIEASKVSTGNVKLNLEKINIAELINQAVGEFEDKFKQKGLETIYDIKENDLNIMADSRYMYRIIENIFSNISKYALENSRVYIDVKKANKQVSIEIKNISKYRLNITEEELMQRFVRGDKSRTTEGSGLGISIAKNLTELQNGTFKLKLDGDLFKVELVFEVV